VDDSETESSHESEPQLALSDALDLPGPNSDWRVFTGPITVADEAAPQEGQVRATWWPRTRLRWHVEARPGRWGQLPALGPVQLTVHSVSTQVDVRGAVITRSSLPGELDGICDQVVFGDVSAALGRVDFLLLNVPAPVDAQALSSPHAVWAGRLRLAFGAWIVVLDAGPDATARQQELEETAGVAATHAGRLSRDDGASFSPAQAAEVLEGLQLALSLARWVAPARLIGYDHNDQSVWQKWADPKIDRWEPGLSWWNGKHTGDLRDYVTCFADVHADPLRRPVLERLARYAVAASGALSVSTEASMLLSQAAIELLAWVRLKPTMSRSQYDKLHFDGELRKLLQLATIDANIPASLPHLRSYQQHRRQTNPALSPHGDGPEILGQIRNDFTHPKLTSPNPEVYTVLDALTDAWRLALHYLDLLILHWIDYHGSYSSRLPDQHSVYDDKPVPWQN